LQGIDCNFDGKLDLIIGNPYQKIGRVYEAGDVWIFYSKTVKSGPKKPIIYTKDNADLCLEGSLIFEWFGFHIDVVKMETKRILIVGAPGYNNGTLNSIGRIYGFNLDIKEKQQMLDFRIDGIYSKGKLGFSFCIGNPYDLSSKRYLALSIPTKKLEGEIEDYYQAGILVLIDIEKQLLGKGCKRLDEIGEMKTIFRADQEFSRFGWQVSFEKDRQLSPDSLFVSVPYLNMGFIETIVDGGAVFEFRGGPSFPIGFSSQSDHTSCLYNPIRNGHFGKNFKILNFDEDSHRDLLVAAPRAETNGQVFLILS